MKTMQEIIDNALKVVESMCIVNNIDESHGFGHAIDVLGFAKQIYDNELIHSPELENQQLLIFMTAIFHDMVDDKYCDDSMVLASEKKIKEFLHGVDLHESEINKLMMIITHMSYSKTKYLDFEQIGGIYADKAFNIVRDADLLAAYDFNRAVIFGMKNRGMSYSESVEHAKALFRARVLLYRDKQLKTDHGRKLSKAMHEDAKRFLATL